MMENDKMENDEMKLWPEQNKQGDGINVAAQFWFCVGRECGW